MEKEALINEKTKASEDMQRLERVISMACEEVPEVSLKMFAEVKVLRLGKVVAYLRKENVELKARATPNTPPEKLA